MVNTNKTKQETRNVCALNEPFKVQWCEIVTIKSVQCHPGLTYIFKKQTADYWHLKDAA